VNIIIALQHGCDTGYMGVISRITAQFWHWTW